jgi:hypothetical protein
MKRIYFLRIFKFEKDGNDEFCKYFSIKFEFVFSVLTLGKHISLLLKALDKVTKDFKEVYEFWRSGNEWLE